MSSLIWPTRSERFQVTHEAAQKFIFAVAAVVCAGIIFRNSGIYSFVCDDEFRYSLYSRLLPLSESAMPNYLYLALFRVTNACGDGYFGCVRLLNAVFFVSAAPFIYGVARHVCGRLTSCWIVLLSLLGPINIYTAFFIPESLYFLLFWVLTWIITKTEKIESRSWLLIGILIGFISLVKPHALIFLPPIAAYIFFLGSSNSPMPWRKQSLISIAFLGCAAVGTKLIGGYVLAGPTGVNLYGSFYSEYAGSPQLDWQNLQRLIFLSLESFSGHLLALCLLFGLPIAYAVGSLISSRSDFSPHRKISFFLLFVLLAHLGVVAVFTAVIADADDFTDTIGRLHLRYYSFAFPLFLIIAAPKISSVAAGFRLRRASLAFPIGVAMVVAASSQLAPFTPFFYDAPELSGYLSNSFVFQLLNGVALLALVIWTYSVRLGSVLFIYLFMPCVIVVSAVSNHAVLARFLEPDVFDRAGNFAKQYLTTDDLGQLLILASENDKWSVYKSMLYIDNASTEVKIVKNDQALEVTSYARGKKWILVIGDVPLPFATSIRIDRKGFTLYGGFHEAGS